MPFLRIFKRKIKSNDDNDDDFDDLSDFDDDFDFDLTAGDPDDCPPNCDSGLHQSVLDLRIKKSDNSGGT
ncbi:hypothetical protein P9112_011803 [Eukaryota sp. TZLM1-RC]